MGRQAAKKRKKPQSFFARHKHIKHILIGTAIIVAAIIGWTAFVHARTAFRQAKLQPFYDTDGLVENGAVGEVVRQEPLGVTVDGGKGVRILYRTQRADGSFTFSSAMVFIPSTSVTAGATRPVVAWAHGTVGMGDSCAPSRTPNPAATISWVSQMLKKGWVVTATDYAGLGTPGTEGYLVGPEESHDVINSVRAARNLPQAHAGNSYVVWGHSQGGHSALFTASVSADYAPELQLVATVASAPAAELVSLLDQQYGTAIDWVIGPEVLVSWPKLYPYLDIKDVTTRPAQRNYEKIASQCIADATLGGITRVKLKQGFFSENLVRVPNWRRAAEQSSAPILAPAQPLMVVESLNDQVVLPNTTALYIQKSCQAGSNLTSLWLAKVGHVQLAATSAPQVISWIGDRFAARATSPTCDQALPIAPAVVPAEL